MPTMFFTDANDSFTVTAAGDYGLVFFDGNDRLTVNGGTFTTATMGEDDDVVTLKAGDGLIYGDGGNDRFEIYAGGFEARGGVGDDIFNIRGGNALTLRGDGGSDQFNFLANSSGTTIHAGDGNDIFNGDSRTISGNIYGDAGNDTFVGFRNAGGIAPNLRGGIGNDTYRAYPSGAANFIENAGEGTDTVEVSGGRNYTLGANIENLIADAFAGTTTNHANLTGNELANVIRGTDNDETINGLDGNDTLDGGYGNDRLNGGNGNDVMDGKVGGDLMTGGSGNDTYYVDDLDDVVTEGSGGGTDLMIITRALGDSIALPAHVENGAIESLAQATLNGNSGNNTLTGGIGNNVLNGAGGSDTLDGGGANKDFLAGGTGNDKYNITDAVDVITENADEGTDTITLDVIVPGPADPLEPVSPLPTYVMADNVENLVLVQYGQRDGYGEFHGPFPVSGNSVANVISGSVSSDVILGGGGDDTIKGRGGIDDLRGGLGNDTIIAGNDGGQFYGDEGVDTIVGARGNDSISGEGASAASFGGDTLTGGGGLDDFIYWSVEDSAPFVGRVDQITDFETGSDRILLFADANANTAAPDQWTVVDGFTGVAGQLWIDSTDAANGNYVLYGDNTGDGLADLMIRIHAPSGFAASDIVL